MKSRNMIDRLIDVGFILGFLVFCYSLGKYVGRDDGYVDGFISGYDFYYKNAYMHLRDSLDGIVHIYEEVQ